MVRIISVRSIICIYSIEGVMYFLNSSIFTYYAVSIPSLYFIGNIGRNLAFRVFLAIIHDFLYTWSLPFPWRYSHSWWLSDSSLSAFHCLTRECVLSLKFIFRGAFVISFSKARINPRESSRLQFWVCNINYSLGIFVNTCRVHHLHSRVLKSRRFHLSQSFACSSSGVIFTNQ